MTIRADDSLCLADDADLSHLSERDRHDVGVACDEFHKALEWCRLSRRRSDGEQARAALRAAETSLRNMKRLITGETPALVGPRVELWDR